MTQQASAVNEMQFPLGYGTSSRLGTLDELRARHLDPRKGAEPEWARRLEAGLVYVQRKHGILMGIGSSGPRPNPHPVSAASMRGQSIHQLQRFNDGTEWYAAADLVVWTGDPADGRANRSPRWGEVQDLELFGIHAFIGEESATKSDDEPWHVQCVEMRGWLGWVTRGRKRPVPGFKFLVDPNGPIDPPENPNPTHPIKPPTTPVNPPTNPPTGTIERHIVDIGIVTCKKGMKGPAVSELQERVNKYGQSVVVDGDFGAKTEAALEKVQAFFKLKADGIAGPATWKTLLEIPHAQQADAAK